MILTPPIRFTDHPPSHGKEGWGSDESYQAACLLDGRYPVRAPDGAYNVQLMDQAAQELPAMDASAGQPVVAARQLVQLLRLAQRPLPAPLVRMAEQRLFAPPPRAAQEHATPATALHTLRLRLASLQRYAGQTIVRGANRRPSKGFANLMWSNQAAFDFLQSETDNTTARAAALALLRLRLATLRRNYEYTDSQGNVHEVTQGAGGKWENNQIVEHGAGKHEGASATPPEQKVEHLPVASIHVGLNPREYFDPSKIAELAESIKAHGLLQPITVRPHDGGYQIIAGERRFRAMQLLGYPHIPAIVLHVEDAQARELALIENINRVDMKPGETARAYQGLRDAGLSVKQISERTGKTAEHIQQHLDLLTLPDHLQRLVDQEKLSLGIVRDLAKLSPPHREEAAERILREDLGVKSAKRLIRTLNERQNQTSMFTEVRPVTHAEKSARTTFEDAISRITAHLATLDDHHMELTAHALDAPAKEAARLQLMIKQLERMKGILETESFRRAGQNAPKPAKGARAKAQRVMRAIDQRIMALRLQVVRVQCADLRRSTDQVRDSRGRFASGGGPALAAHRDAEQVSRSLAKLPAAHPDRAGLQAQLDHLSKIANDASVSPQEERAIRLLRHVVSDRLYPAGVLHPKTEAALRGYIATIDRFAARRFAQGDRVRLTSPHHGFDKATVAATRAELAGIVQDLEARHRGQRVSLAALQRNTPLFDDKHHFAGSAGSGGLAPLPSADAFRMAALEPFGHSAMATYRFEAEGRDYFAKAVSPRELRHELAAHAVGHAVGVGDHLLPVQGYTRMWGGKEQAFLVMPWLDGKPLAEINHGHVVGLLDDATVARFALFHYLIGENDRHLYNYLQGRSGRVYSIDYAYAFQDGRRYKAEQIDELVKAHLGLPTQSRSAAAQAYTFPLPHGVLLGLASRRAMVLASAAQHGVADLASLAQRFDVVDAVSQEPSPILADLDAWGHRLAGGA